jgi:hypothetical protein
VGLLTYTQIEDGFSATANLWNSRFAPLYDEINGNLDSSNLANDAVTEAKIAAEAVTASKLAAQSVLPSKVNNTWVGTTSSLAGVDTSWSTRFNKTITLPEAAYIFVLWTARGNANTTSVDPGVRILVNDVAVYTLEAGTGLELMTAKTNADMTFAISGMGPDKYSGNVNVKLQTKSSVSNGWDCGAGFARIDALGDDTYLG